MSDGVEEWRRRVTLSNSALAAALCCGCLSEPPFIKWWLSVQKVRKTFQFKHNKMFKWELYISFGKSIHLDYNSRLLIKNIIFIRIYYIKWCWIFSFLENCLEAAADTKYIYLCLVGLQLVNGPRIDWGIGNLFVSSWNENKYSCFLVDLWESVSFHFIGSLQSGPK